MSSFFCSTPSSSACWTSRASLRHIETEAKSTSPPKRREKESTSIATRGETCYLLIFVFHDTALEKGTSLGHKNTCIACSVQSKRFLPPPLITSPVAKLSPCSSIINVCHKPMLNVIPLVGSDLSVISLVGSRSSTSTTKYCRPLGVV